MSAPTWTGMVTCPHCGTNYPLGSLHSCPTYVPTYQPNYYIQYPPTYAPQGWTCPKCGRVWSPSTDGCSPCNAVASAAVASAAVSLPGDEQP